MLITEDIYQNNEYSNRKDRRTDEEYLADLGTGIYNQFRFLVNFSAQFKQNQLNIKQCSGELKTEKEVDYLLKQLTFRPENKTAEKILITDFFEIKVDTGHVSGEADFQLQHTEHNISIPLEYQSGEKYAQQINGDQKRIYQHIKQTKFKHLKPNGLLIHELPLYPSYKNQQGKDINFAVFSMHDKFFPKNNPMTPCGAFKGKLTLEFSPEKEDRTTEGWNKIYYLNKDHLHDWINYYFQFLIESKSVVSDDIHARNNSFLAKCRHRS